MTTTFENTTTCERPTEGSVSNCAAEQTKFPALFWAAVILFVVNLLVIVGIWLSPELRVSYYGAEEGVLAGSYPRPSPFTERVSLAAARKPRQPEKVRPILYQEPQSVEAADLSVPRTSMPVSTERTAYAQQLVNEYSNDMPRMTASAARPADRVVHVGTVDSAPQRVME